jgi:signal transduction histidine kinase/DNA-binding response OmpR family regulator
MKKIYLLICLLATSALYPKNGLVIELESIGYINELYAKMSQEALSKPIDITIKRAGKILNFVEKQQRERSEVSTSSRKIYGNTALLLMHIFDAQKEYDSVGYYYQKVSAQPATTEILGNAELYISNKKAFEKKYFESIRSLYDALTYFEEANAVDKQVEAYLKLAAIYKKIRNFDLSKEMDSILMNHYLQKPISKLLKTQIRINNALYTAFTGNNEEAIRLLKSLDVQDFSSNKKVLRSYYRALKRRYLKNDNIDSARIYMNKLYKIENAEQPEDEAIRYIYKAMIALKSQEYEKSLSYIKKAKKSEALQYVEQFDMIKLHKVAYLANEALGNYKVALEASTNYHTVRNAVKNFNLNLNASILNFKLNHDKKIKALEEKSEVNALMMNEKKKFYIFSTFFVSASVLILIFLFILHKRKKNQLKLQYENDKMKEIAEIKNNFIENLSHEIRTPITITTGYLRMITNNAMDYSKIVKYADLTVRNNEQIIHMLNNFLTLLKLNKKTTDSKLSTQDLETFLRESIYAFQGVAEIKGVYVYYKSNIVANQKIEYAYEDLRKIINNLVSNALKYTSPTYGIYVHTFIDKNGLTIIVKDEGIGIHKKEQRLIFDRFYQTKNNLTNGGFGIGLSLVKELVKKLKGTIHLESKENVGSIFTIQLPLALENPLLYAKEKESVYQNIAKPENLEDTQQKNLPKILIVDDNIEMIGYLKNLLQPTFDCTFAFDGAQAVVFARKEQYDLVLSDLRMPLMNGHHLKSVLNTMEQYASTPFMMMTASAEEYLEYRKDELDIDDYLIKPFEGMELLTRIHYHLENDMYAKQLQNIGNEAIVYNGAYAEFMEKVNTIILENLTNNDFTINELAKKCGYSHKQLIQIVQEKTRLTPVKLILEIRLRKAYDLIVNDKYDNISEILYSVGLNSRSYFNKVFVKRFGLKPGELIKKCKIQKKAS